MSTQTFNIIAIAQRGRLEAEALLLAASLRASGNTETALYLAEPQPGDLWQDDPRISLDFKEELLMLGATILPFENEVFGQSYPNGNKIEALAALPKAEPFLFLDTDVIVTSPLPAVPIDFSYPSASLNRSGTWPKPDLYGPGYTAIWKSLYDRFELDFEGSLEPGQPDEYWERYLYFNAGWFYGADPHAFGSAYLNIAREIRDNPPGELSGQAIYPWLDQIALPLTIHRLGGGRAPAIANALEGPILTHWRKMSLFFSRAGEEQIEFLEKVTAPNRIKKLLKQHSPFHRAIYRGEGRRIRKFIAERGLRPTEAQIRKRLKNNKLWLDD